MHNLSVPLKLNDILIAPAIVGDDVRPAITYSIIAIALRMSHPASLIALSIAALDLYLVIPLLQRLPIYRTKY